MVCKCVDWSNITWDSLHNWLNNYLTECPLILLQELITFDRFETGSPSILQQVSSLVTVWAVTFKRHLLDWRSFVNSKKFTQATSFEGLIKALSGCTMGSLGAFVFEKWPTLETRNQDISDSASFWPFLFKSFSFNFIEVLY